MCRYFGIKLLGLLGRLAVVVALLAGAVKLLGGTSYNRLPARVYALIAQAIDRTIGWDKLPLPVSVVTLIGLRLRLRQRNLYDTSTLPSTPQPDPVPEGTRHLNARTADGTFNDLQNPRMGSVGTRFGRNVPHEHTYRENDWEMLTPNPRTVSRELHTRESFIDARKLNELADG